MYETNIENETHRIKETERILKEINQKDRDSEESSDEFDV
jgi:hypothetical protein